MLHTPLASAPTPSPTNARTAVSNAPVLARSGPPDSGPPDSGPPDSGPPDSGPPDSPFAIAEALLKSPGSILRDIQEGRGALLRLSVLAFASLALVGFVVASFSGGLQFLLVPLKLVFGVFFCAVICLPSLHVFSCLAGATQSLKETWGALLMGVALTALLLVGFAPIAWIFSQATTSVAFMGALYLGFFILSCVLGLGLVQRTLTAMNGVSVRGLRAWMVLFVLVVFQMTTTLRPLLGEAGGPVLQGRLFFFAHWLAVLRA